MKIVADQRIPYVKDYFQAYGDLVLIPGRTISHDDVSDADILLVRSITEVNKTLLQNSKVGFVGSVTAGKDHIDLEYLNTQSIAWSIAAGFNAPPVADYVISTIAALKRKKILLKKNPKIALIGVGHIGTEVAKRLAAIPCELVYCDPLRAQTEKDFPHTALEDIADVDLISLHVPLTKDGEFATQHMINAAFLQRQLPTCILINTSRGKVIDTEALQAHGKHMSWCFDVWEHEPNINLEMLQQVLLGTPHIAGYSVQSKIRGTKMIYQAACQRKVISENTIHEPNQQQQILRFSEAQHNWEDIVLGIFNPVILTAMMRTQLTQEQSIASAFDAMRSDFNYRHEFAYTKVLGPMLQPQDAAVLQALGIKVMPL